jgi:hypothetical protein
MGEQSSETKTICEIGDLLVFDTGGAVEFQYSSLSKEPSSDSIGYLLDDVRRRLTDLNQLYRVVTEEEYSAHPELQDKEFVFILTGACINKEESKPNIHVINLVTGRYNYIPMELIEKGAFVKRGKDYVIPELEKIITKYRPVVESCKRELDFLKHKQ